MYRRENNEVKNPDNKETVSNRQPEKDNNGMTIKPLKSEKP